jgi:hypothetical protein
MGVDYKKKIGFKGQFYIESKPKEPTKHQFDFDAGNCMAFLQKYDLMKDFKLNIKANHATLASHTFQHELQLCVDNGILGSVDANCGNLMLGWDTDQFPTDLYNTTLAMYIILKGGGFKTGGLNFDAKVRRQSIDPEDLFHAHIGAMDTFARGLKTAAKMIKDKKFEKEIKTCYADLDKLIDQNTEEGRSDFEELNAHAPTNTRRPFLSIFTSITPSLKKQSMKSFRPFCEALKQSVKRGKMQEQGNTSCSKELSHNEENGNNYVTGSSWLFFNQPLQFVMLLALIVLFIIVILCLRLALLNGETSKSILIALCTTIGTLLAFLNRTLQYLMFYLYQ